MQICPKIHAKLVLRGCEGKFLRKIPGTSGHTSGRLPGRLPGTSGHFRALPGTLPGRLPGTSGHFRALPGISEGDVLPQNGAKILQCVRIAGFGLKLLKNIAVGPFCPKTSVNLRTAVFGDNFSETCKIFQLSWLGNSLALGDLRIVRKAVSLQKSFCKMPRVCIICWCGCVHVQRMFLLVVAWPDCAKLMP